MPSLKWTWLVLVATVIAPPQTEAQDAARQRSAWNPAKTFVFAISSTEWKFDHKLNMPKKGREDQDLVDAFRKRGVPHDQLVFLKDQQGTLAHINRSFVELLGKTRHGDTLIFYFQGHGGRDIVNQHSRYYFINYDANPHDDNSYLYMHHVLDTIERHFKGSQVLLTADCCCSGGLLVEANSRQNKLACACLTSVAAHNSSTGHWTYTDALARGIRGDSSIDLNDDGTITLAELNHDIQMEMAILESQKAAFGVVNHFDPELVLGAALRRAHAEVGKFVDAKQNGVWYHARVEAVDGDRVQVAYVGYNEKEWVARDRLRPLETPHFPVGARVQVNENGKLRRAVVKNVFHGLHQLHFDNDKTGPRGLMDEWFAYDALKALP